MSKPYPRPFTYEEAVFQIATSVREDFCSVPSSAVAMAAFALSLAYNIDVATVHGDIKSAMARKEKSK